MPRPPGEVVALVTDTGRVSESKIEPEFRVRGGRNSKGESPSLGSLTMEGLSYSIVYDFTVTLRERGRNEGFETQSKWTHLPFICVRRVRALSLVIPKKLSPLTVMIRSPTCILPSCTRHRERARITNTQPSLLWQGQCYVYTSLQTSLTRKQGKINSSSLTFAASEPAVKPATTM